MVENPLLPNARLRTVYLTMRRAIKLSVVSRGPRLEALLAGTLLHVEEGDFVLPLPDSICLPLLATLGVDIATPQPSRDLLMLATGAALALKEADRGKFALALVRSEGLSNAEAGWADALRYAAAARLPLLVVCVATVKPSRTSGKSNLTWENLQAVAKPLHLPVMPIDGEDAVAVHRAMQESVIRARNNGGCAVLWCVFPSGQTPAPVDRFRDYLRARGLGRLAR